MDKKIELIKKWEKCKPEKTPVIFSELNGQRIAIKDESQNKTDTYKDKHGWMMGLDYLENYFPNSFIYYLGSTGNAGIADFAYADKLNELLGEYKVTVVNFYPTQYDKKLLGPDTLGRFTDGKTFRERMEQFKSGKLIQVDFNERYWFGQPCIEEMEKYGLIATPKNSMDITEGFKPTYNQVMEEFIDQIKEKDGYIPKTLAIIQYGAGMLYDDSKAIAKDLPIDFIAVSSGNKDTIADKICDSSESWQESLTDLTEKGFTKAKNSGDKIYGISEQEIRSAMAIFKTLGIESEPSGSAGMAIIPRINEIVKEQYELIAVINTGNGIKKCAYKL